LKKFKNWSEVVWEAPGYRDFEIERCLTNQEIRSRQVAPAEPESRPPAPLLSRRGCGFHEGSRTLWQPEPMLRRDENGAAERKRTTTFLRQSSAADYADALCGA
jgi:hypothetical protein